MTEVLSVDVAIVGSGPAGVAVAEQLARSAPELSIAVIERGPLVLRQHFYHGGGSIQERDDFLARHRVRPWLGSMSEGGALLPIVGGRGTLGGAQLHRFYAADLTAWPHSEWPMTESDLAPYFDLAESSILGRFSALGSSQQLGLELFDALGVKHPPHSTQTEEQADDSGGYPHRSSVERLLALVEGHETRDRVRLLAGTTAIRFRSDSGDASRPNVLECRRSDGDHDPVHVEFRFAVLAASAVESARLAMNSLPAEQLSLAAGRYLAEHIYVRGFVDVAGTAFAESPLNLFIPPQGDDPDARFQIEIRSAGRDSNGRVLVRVTGSAAMDPRAENRMWLRPDLEDDLGAPRVETKLEQSPGDARRTARMIEAMRNAQRLIGADWSDAPRPLAVGSSYHECGTLRMGAAPGDARAADIHGLIDGFDNVFTGDGSAFPTVGVANPILTLTAMGYRLGDHLSRVATASRPS